MKQDCDHCKCRRNIVSSINLFMRGFKRHIGLYTIFAFFIIAIVVYIIMLVCHSNLIYLQAIKGILLISFGLIFPALKYDLDKANYHKDLFEKRYEVFNKVNEIFWAYFHQQEENWQPLIKEFDSIYRQSYFLFSKKTYAFLDEFRRALLNATHTGVALEKKEQAQKFLCGLIDGQRLSEKFPELKIDAY